MMEGEPDLDLDLDFDSEIKKNDILQLRNYYDKLFPFELIYDWLTINSVNENLELDKKRAFEKREFSFRISKLGKSFVIRNKSFNKIEDLKEFLKGRMGNDGIYEVPEKLDIGAIMSWEPSKMTTVTDYHPIAREFVIDIDVDDYNQIRTCCASTSLCEKCWGFLGCAAEFLDNYLRECFGFEQILYVFSGRRGLHLWISDRSAQTLSKENRCSIINHIKAEITNNQLPILKSSYDSILLPHFEEHIVSEQTLFTNEKQRNYFLKHLVPFSVKKDKKTLKPHDDIKSKVEQFIKDDSSITDKEIWLAIKFYFTDNNLKEYLYQMVYHYTLPRIDEAVSIGVNHLLKAPFCIHPDTKKLCVPIDLSEIHNFNPDQVPTCDQLSSDPKLFNKYKQIFKNHINQMKLKYNLSIQDPMEF